MKVVNIYKTDKYNVYIGRAGWGHSGYYGNPIVINKTCPLCKLKHNRTETLKCYDIYLRLKLTSDSTFREKVKGLNGLILGCFCAPQACHGDVLTQYAEELFNMDKI